jgi:streptogramin lyase
MRTLRFLCAATLLAGTALAATVSTIVGTGTAGYSDTEVNNPYGMTIGPDGALYFCDLGNQRVRRFDLKTKRVTLIAGNGKAGYSGDGGPATEASLRAPHELTFDLKGDLYFAERDNHVIRKVDMKTGIISTVAGTGVAGYGGDGGPAAKAQLRQPHSVIRDKDGTLLICDLGNHRIRRLHLDTGIIETFAGTGVGAATPEGAPVSGTPVNGPRSIVLAKNGDLYVALREGNAILRIDAKTKTFHRVAGTGETGYSGDGGPPLNATFGGSAQGRAASLAGPKGLALGPDGTLYIADTDSHAIRKIDPKTGIITTILGTGMAGDGPETNPLECKLSRPHAVLFTGGNLYVADSEAHRILLLSPGGSTLSTDKTARAQVQPELEEYLEALERSASNFAASAPGLIAEETLDQHGRRGFVEIMRGKKDEIKTLDFTLPDDFHDHKVVSNYGLAEVGHPRVLHEIRTIVTIDGKPLPDAGEARHVLTASLQSPDDETKRRLLEDLDRNQLEGAVTDFGQLILLFGKGYQGDYRFSISRDRGQRLAEEPVEILRYKQVSGAEGLTFFKNTSDEEREPAAGQIWLRARDLIPVRITFNTEEYVSKKFTIRTEATVDYVGSPVGLVPQNVTHKQFLNSDLMVENDLRYGEFHRVEGIVP